MQSEEDERISFPNLNVYSETSPGPWLGLLDQQQIKIKPLFIKEGLESVLMLTIAFPVKPDSVIPPMKITDIYIADYQDIILTHKTYSTEPSEAAETFRLNGILNYVQVFLVDKERGIFRKELPLRS